MKKTIKYAFLLLLIISIIAPSIVQAGVGYDDKSIKKKIDVYFSENIDDILNQVNLSLEDDLKLLGRIDINDDGYDDSGNGYSLYKNGAYLGELYIKYISEEYFWSFKTPINIGDRRNHALDEVKNMNPDLYLEILHESEKKLDNIIDTKDLRLNAEYIKNNVYNSKYISLKITENQQDDEYWCSAYAGATIIRTIKNTYITARQMIENYHGYMPYESLKKCRLSVDQVKEYASLYNLHPKEYKRPMALSSIAGAISQNRPFFTVGNRSGNRHAFVVRGYNLSAKTASVWNPWGQYITYTTNDNKIYAENNRTYILESSLYGW
ncbi:MAG: hypothetical protein GXY87_03420 [Tissierellia bacterium]|nr:hypothetical protein [Tissierellia bacterium]